MKFFLKSKTIIGIIVSILPQVLPEVGVSFSADDGALINSLVDSIVNAAGLVLAAYGRFVADRPLKVTP